MEGNVLSSPRKKISGAGRRHCNTVLSLMIHYHTDSTVDSLVYRYVTKLPGEQLKQIYRAPGINARKRRNVT